MTLDPDILLTAGLILALLSLPSILSALGDRRAPRASAMTVLLAGALILYAARTKPGGYQVDQIPQIVLGTIAQFLP
jgi:hypothetical protein